MPSTFALSSFSLSSYYTVLTSLLTVAKTQIREDNCRMFFGVYLVSLRENVLTGKA